MEESDAAVRTGAEVVAEGAALITGDRQKLYGHPLDNFSDIKTGWEVILKAAVTEEQVGLMMAWVKICRENNVPHPEGDNMRDLAGYAGTVEMVKVERAERVHGLTQFMQKVKEE